MAGLAFWRNPIKTTVRAVRNFFNNPVQVFDSKKAQDIYRNSDRRFLFAGGLSRTIIDYTTSFVGVPSVRIKGGGQDAAMVAFDGYKSKLMMSVRDSLIESMVYVRFDFKVTGPYSSEPEVTFEIIENTRVIPLIDNRGMITGYRVTSDVRYDSTDSTKTYRMEEYIYADHIDIVRDSPPAGLLPKERVELRFGILPIVPIVNEPDKDGNGTSDLEPLTAYLSIYNNIVEQANNYLNLHSEPKLKIRVKDYAAFETLNQNLYTAEGTLDVGGGSVFFVNSEDNVEYVTVTSAMGDFTSLLQYTFYNIVQTSQTPEFLMGVAIASSKASAQEQKIILDVKTSRKRTLYHEQFLLLYRVFSTVYGKTNGQVYDYKNIELEWENVEANVDDISGDEEVTA